ncbi:MAG: GDSL-type esterase/lipase family protein [Planctomycetota bacterium]|jgi:lysophospholipase L1-like esterase|nr:GDSL-type esterase/lipase family protein [Planctomycetota bacterium]
MKHIILIGDSIRVGYAPYVGEELSGRANVWGPEKNGGTSENVLNNLGEWVLSRKADVVHMNAGLHDLKKGFEEEENNIPVQQYAENVRAILTGMKEGLSARLIWALITPVNEKWHHERKGFDRFEADVLAFNKAAKQVAVECGVEVHDLYQVVVDAGPDKLLRPDGVHFTPEGSALLGKKVAEMVMQQS